MYFLILLFAFNVNAALPNSEIAKKEVLKENYFNSFKKAMQTGDLTIQIGLVETCVIECNVQNRLALLALDELVDEPAYQNNIANFLNSVDLKKFSGKDISQLDSISARLQHPAAEEIRKRIKEIQNFEEPVFWNVPPKIPLTREQVKAIFTYRPPLGLFENGSYNKTLRLFMFCRISREYPCLMVLKDKNDLSVYYNHVIWSQPALAFTKNEKPYYLNSGVTPQGVMLINGVMPFADQKESFGKFRRLILNFIESSKNEINYKTILPPGQEVLNWWKETSVARDAGRDLFRIHGTGVINYNPQLPFFPLTPTKGCISKRENSYNGVEYVDQQILLNEMMMAMGLSPVYQNEELIRGLLYVIEIDDIQAPVTLKDLARYGVN